MSEQEGIVFWLTGLSGCGKTTIGHTLTLALRENGRHVVFLDGDILREITGDIFGHNREQRLQASFLYARLCRMLAKQHVDVVCATISLFREIQEWNRKNFSRYFEVFIDVPLSELVRRDSKNIYAQVKAGKLQNVVGLDIPADFPKTPDLVIKNHGEMNVSMATSLILKHLQDHQ